MPPPTPNPPADNKVIVEDLSKAGVVFVQVPASPTNYITGEVSLPKIWTWNKDALRVPGLELKLTTTQTALNKSGELVTNLNKTIDLSNKVIIAGDQREQQRIQQVDLLNKQVKITTDQVKAEKVNGWLKAGIALAVGYLGGRAVK